MYPLSMVICEVEVTAYIFSEVLVSDISTMSALFYTV